MEVLHRGRVIATLSQPSREVLAKKPKVDRRKIARFCKKYQIKLFALFGSITRDDFSSDSDVDVLVDEVRRGGPISTLEGYTEAREDLIAMFGRSVDLVNKRVLLESKNDIRRSSILDSLKVIYAAPKGGAV